jgi:hypothetical protein
MAEPKLPSVHLSAPIPTPKHNFAHVEQIEHLLQHHQSFHLTRENAEQVLGKLKEDYLNKALGSAKSGLYRLKKTADVNLVRKALNRHTAHLDRHKIKHNVVLDVVRPEALHKLYEGLVNAVAVSFVAHLFNGTKDDMELTSLSDDIHSRDVSDLTAIFHIYAFLLSTGIKKHTTDAHNSLRHDLCATIANLMDRYVDLRDEGVFSSAFKTCGSVNFMNGMIGYFTSLKGTPILTRMQYLLILYATDESRCGTLLKSYGLGKYTGTAQTKALVEFVRERNTTVALNYAESSKEMDDALTHAYKSTMTKIKSTLSEDARLTKRAADALAEFKAKYGHLSESDLIKPINMLDDLSRASNKGDADALTLRKEMLYMRLPQKALQTWKPSQETLNFCTSLAKSLETLLRYYDDMDKLEEAYLEYVAHTDMDSEDYDQELAENLKGALGNPMMRSLGKVLRSLTSSFFGTVKFELSILLLYQILYASGDAAIFGDWANYVLGLVACVYMMMSGNTNIHTGGRSLMANLRHNTELALKVSKDQIIQTASRQLFEADRVKTVYQLAAAPVSTFMSYKLRMFQASMDSNISMITRFGIAAISTNGMNLGEIYKSFSKSLSLALFSPSSAVDSFRKASAVIVARDQIYREKFIELFKNLVGHVDVTLGQFLREALTLMGDVSGVPVNSAAFDLRVAMDGVAWYYREALRYSGMLSTLIESAIPYVDSYRSTPSDDSPSRLFGILATVVDKIYAKLGDIGLSPPTTVIDKALEGDFRGLLQAGWSSFVDYAGPVADSVPYSNVVRDCLVDGIVGGLRTSAVISQKAACNSILVLPAVLLGIGVNSVGILLREVPAPGFTVLGTSLRRTGRKIANLSFRDHGTMTNAILDHLKGRIAESASIVMSQMLAETFVVMLEKGIGLDGFLSGPQERLLISLFLNQVFISAYNGYVSRRLGRPPKERERDSAPALPPPDVQSKAVTKTSKDDDSKDKQV